MPRNEDLIINANVVNPAKANDLFKEYSYKQAHWKKLDDKYSGRFPAYTKIFGQPIKSIADLIPIGDNLNVRKIHGRPLPSGITGPEAIDLAILSKKAEMLQYQPKQVGNFLGGALLNEINKYMKNASLGKEQYKYAIFSAHDSNLLAIMSALGAPCNPYDVAEYPSYAGFINFTLYKDNGKYTVYVDYYANEHQYPDYSKNDCKVVKSASFSLSNFVRYLETK